jgi:hypothetical protein
MTLREDLRGVRRVDLASAVLIVPTLIFGCSLAMAKDAPETQVPVQETQVQETQVPADEYKAVWDWCGVRFPYREDLQEACRWGAYKMLPGQEAPADEGMQDA